MNQKTSKAISLILAVLLLSGCVTYPDRAFLDAHAEWQECKWQEAAGSHVYCGVEPDWSSWQGY